MKTQVYDNMYRTTIVCVDAYENDVLCGRMYNPYFEGGLAFKGTMELLKNMDAMLEKMNYPQAFSGKRVFWASEEKTPEAVDETARSGKLATFALRVLFRQNASWQGSLAWYEGKREESFRSVLELLLLIDSALHAE